MSASQKDSRASAAAPTPAEEAFRASEERFRLCMEATHDGLWDWNIQTDEAYFSPAYFRMLGYEATDFPFTGQTWKNLVHSDDLERAWQANLDCIEGQGESFEVEFRMQARDGRWRWILSRGKCISRGADGRALRLVGTHVDITDRKQVEEALRESEQRLRTVLENSGDGIRMVDLTTERYTFLSPAQVEMTGFTVEELQDLTVQQAFERIHPDDRESARAQQRQVAAGEDSSDPAEYRWMTKSGEYRWFSDRRKLVRDAQGRPVSLVGISRDITEGKRAEEARRASEEQFRAIFENAAVGVVQIDLQARFVLVNDKYCEITGYSREELLQRTVADLTHPDDREWDSARLSRFLQGRTSVYDAEKRYVRKDGSTIWVQVTSAMIRDAAGRPFRSSAVIQDITERKQIEASLHESEERLRLIGDNLPDSAVYQYLCETNGKGRFLYFSAGCERLNGVSAEEVMRDEGVLHRQLSPEYRERFREAQMRSAREMSDLDIEVPIHGQNGQVRWMRVHSRPHRLPDGRMVWNGVQSEITRQRQAEQAVRESEERLRFALETSHTGAWDIDLESHAAYRSLEHDRIFGYSELLPQWTYETFLEHVLPADRPAVDKEFRQAIETQGDWDFECRIRRADGQVRWIWASGRHRPSTVGSERRMAGIVQDITERKAAEAALHEAEERRKVIEAVQAERQRLFDVLETLPAKVCLLTREHRIVFANRQFREHFGEPNGRLCYDLCHGLTQPCEYCESFEVFKTGRPHRWEISKPDGSMTVEAYDFPFTDVDGSPMVLKMDIDITDRKRAEKELQKHQENLEELVRERTRQLEAAKSEAERANAAKDQFLAALSHELRTPLTPVLMIGQLYAEDRRLPEEVRMDMETIRQHITLEARLIDDLLDLTRITRGKVHLELEQTDVHALLREALRICTHDHVLHKKLRVCCDMAAGQSRVFGDPVRLEQVFWNLIKNAVKFTPEGGEITIRTENNGDRIRILVCDTGVGIEPDKLQSIFDAFEQGGTERTRQFGGLGLGLAISKGIVELHAGRIEAVSKGLGKGATMIVELPVAVEAGRSEATPVSGSVSSDAQTAPALHKRILLVEDHGPTAFVMRRLMTRWGYEVDLAMSVKAAKELANKRSFDLVISDLGLPDGHGHDLMAHLKQQHGLLGFALSGYGTEADVEKSLAAGFVQHLTKPVDFDQLRKAIAAVMA